MDNLLLCTVLLALLGLASTQIYLTTCATMDVPILDKAAQAACILSCSLQNCGTGYCENRRGRKTCVCSRCGKGSNLGISIPLEALIKKGK